MRSSEAEKVQRRTSLVSSEVDTLPPKQISVVSDNSKSSERARVRAKRCGDESVARSAMWHLCGE